MKLLMLGAAILCFSFSVRGQEWKSLSVDELFKTARQNAFDGDRLQARMKLHEILNRTPAYDEVAVFLARTFIWDGEYDSARLILQNLLSKNPHNREAMLVLSDAFGWSGNYSDALATVNVWLTSNPNDEDFLYKKGSYLKELGKNAESAAVLQTLLSIQPSHKKASELLQEFKRQNQRNAVTGSYSADIFNRTFSPAQFAYMQIARSYRWGTGMARVNFANRFTQSGTQAEFDIYPRLLKGTYGYFNYGYSSSALFPVHRIGAEFYSKLPKSLEISAGARYLNYGSSTPVIIYTGSLGWYFKNNWVSVRPYFTPGSTNSFSTYFFARHYLKDGNNYIGFSYGFGFSPDERRLQSSNGLSSDNIYMLKAQRIGLQWQKTLAHNWMLSTTVFVAQQELSFEHGNYVWITSPLVSLRKSF